MIGGQGQTRASVEMLLEDGNVAIASPLDTALPPQVGTIVKKADKDKDEVIDFEEFVKETPKVTLCQPRRKVRPVNSVSSRLWV